MRKLIMLTILALFSNTNTLLTNANSNLSDYWNKYYLYDYQITSSFNIISDKASTIFDYNGSSIMNLPLGLPINVDSTNRISSYYGERQKHPILQIKTFHNGIDITADLGTSVYPTAEGKVVRTGYHFYGYGKFVEISHTERISTIYAHLNTITVNAGDTVDMFTLIGTVGSTGLSTGCHLHYEVRKDFEPINPLIVYNELEISKEDILELTKLTKIVQMKTKDITKTYSLDELKALKDDYAKRINIRQYNIKNGKVKKPESLKASLDKIELDQKNLIRIKEVLASANNIDFDEKDVVAINTNNHNIFKLSLLRDLKTTLSSDTVKNSKEFTEIANEKLKTINSAIKELDTTIKAFNSDITVEITLLEEE